MKPIERLLFEQGGLCFFCDKPLQRADASVEHLVASAKGGGDEDDNCVVCCKSLNGILGSKSVKQKLQVIFKQKGDFKCPNGAQKPAAKVKPAKSPLMASLDDKYSHLVKNLKKRGDTKPGTLPKLKSTIASIFQKSDPDEVEALVQRLQSKNAISIAGSTVTYRLGK